MSEKISWRLTVSINETPNLYQDMRLPYRVDAYICRCGMTEFIIKDEIQQIDYQCPECENTHFEDAGYYLKDFAWTHEHREYEKAWYLEEEESENYNEMTLPPHFPARYHTIHDKDKIVSTFGVEIPNAIDLVRESVSFTLKPLWSIALHSDGRIEEKFTATMGKEIGKTIKHNLLDYIKAHNSYKINIALEKITSLDRASFFTRYKNLQEFEFYYWNNTKSLDQSRPLSIEEALHQVLGERNERSIKKALFQNYQKQIGQKCFYPDFIQAFIKHISDPNIVVSLLSLELPLCDETFGVEEAMVEFLLETGYSQKQILHLFKESSDKMHRYLFCDLLREFSNVLIDLSFFRKVPCTLYAIHDELLAASRKIYQASIANQQLHYTKLEERLCIKVDAYEARLPRNGLELVEWSDRLSNCLSGYFRRILQKESTVYGFFKEGKLRFAAEIHEGRILQASSRFNAALDSEESEILKKWHKGYMHYYVNRVDTEGESGNSDTSRVY